MHSFKYCLTTRQTVWFVDDVAPAHLRREVRQVFELSLHRSIDVVERTVSWPSRSPDLTPADFYLCLVKSQQVGQALACD
jgi:hypothetical protein